MNTTLTKRKLIVTGGLVITVCLLICATVYFGNETPTAIVNEFDGLYPSLSDISDDGGIAMHIKRSNTRKRGYIVTVINNRTKEEKILFESHEPVMRSKLSPDGQKLGYFLQDEKTNVRKLQIWSLVGQERDSYDIGEVYAQPSVQWSPDSRRLAFNTPGKLFMIVDSAGKTQCAVPLAFKAFDWSPDGKDILGCNSENNTLTRINAETGEIAGEFPVLDFDKIHELCWTPHGLPRVRATKDGDANHYLVEIGDGRQDILYKSGSGLSRIMSLGNGELLLNEKIGGDRKFCILRNGKPDVLRLEGSITPLKPDDDGSFYVRQVTTVKYNILKVSPAGGILDEYTSNGSAVNTNHVHKVTSLPLKDESLLFWVAENTSKPITAFVIIISGGNDIYIPPERWTETQMYLNRGYGVIHVAPPHNGDGSEIALLIDYILGKYQIPESNIAVVAASTSAYLAISAAQHRPSFAGILVLTSVIMASPLSEGSALLDNNKLRVLAYHGDKDRKISAEDARALIVDALGGTCLGNPRSVWKIFEGEDHSLVNDKNRIHIINSLLKCLP
jgi:hypothetical protein